MQTIRRLYLYAVTLVSMEVVLWGAIGLVRSILEGREIGGSASQLASALSLILVGVPVFLIHWWLAQRSAASDPEERSARLRAIFFYGALLATLVPVVQNLLALVNRGLLSASGLSSLQALIGGSQTLSENLIAMVLNGALAAYLFSILRGDWNTPLQGEAYPETRRVYRYLWMLYGLGMVVLGVQQVLKSILGIPGSVESGTPPFLANGLSLLLIGAPLWFFVWRWIQHWLGEPTESQSLLRLLVLYLLSFISVGGVLASAGFVLEVILLAAFGEAFNPIRFLAAISNPLSIAVPLGGVWAYYGRRLNAEMKTRPDLSEEIEPALNGEKGLSPRRTQMQRLYSYVLSFFGLGATFIGLQMLLAFILDFTLKENAVWGGTLRDNLAVSLSTLIIGLPLWIFSWRPMAREASEDGEAGDRARRSLIRKGYLFLILFAGVMGVMFSAGSLLFQLLSALLGQPPQELLLSSLQLLKVMALFAIFLIFHWQALRADGRLAEKALARRHAQFPVLVLTSEEGVFSESLVNALEREAPGLPVAVHPFTQGVPDETLSAAKAVIVPAELIAKPSEAIRLWLQGFTGIKLLIPTPAPDWHWVFGSGRPLSALTRQTANIVRHLAEGEDLPQPRETSPWMILVYLFAGLFGLVLAVGLVSLGISLFLQ